MRISFVNKHKPSKLIRGTGFIDYFVASEKELVTLFGEPLDVKYIDQYKSSKEWHVEIQHDSRTVGAIAIYDYKVLAPEDATRNHHWHLGGRSKQLALDLIDFVTHCRDVTKRYNVSVAKQVATDR